jgi:hypothetical protein
MSKWVAALLLMVGLIGASAVLAEEPDVEYVNGTVKGLKDGTTGAVDMSSPAALEFRAGSNQFSIPYDQIKHVKCREENRFRLGVLATIAVGLLKARSKRHFVVIEWTGEDGRSEVVTLDASKVKARGMVEVLRFRAPHVCPPGPVQPCGFGE